MPAMVELLMPYVDRFVDVLIEESQPMPGQGTRSTFTSGSAMGSGWGF